ncbi:MAG: S-methyl-5'-thioinosine phosphorylase [Pseudomonadota bacterium]
MPISNQPDISAPLAIIGGSGLYSLGLGTLTATHQVATPFTTEAVDVMEESIAGKRVLFVPRHGKQHSLAPHQINYRANVWALRELGVTGIIAVNAVGGISPGMTAGRLVIPNQLIDYSWGREHTYFTSEHSLDRHIDFTDPYDARLAQQLARSAKRLQVDFAMGVVYGCTQGPRLETAAEVRRLLRDGCDIVGMTGMPEAGLARELGLPYACLALVVNRAAGMGESNISIEAMRQVLQEGTVVVRNVLRQLLQA